MPRILISWIATGHDFVRSSSPPKVNEEGPTSDVHQNFWHYDCHLLLSQKHEAIGDPRLILLQRSLAARFPTHVVEPVFVGLDDVISVDEIRGKVEKLLLSHRDAEIDILASTGTSSMMTAWYFVHFGLGLKTRLFQLRPKEFTVHKKHGEQIFETIEQSAVPSSLAIRQADVARIAVSSSDFKLTPSIESVYERASLVARTDDATCLILGPTGTGKEHLARYIHNESARHAARFVPVNCSALGTGDLLESRLFGYGEGVFTDQKKGGRSGIFEDANRGTLFLDEIGDAPPELQQMLLRVLQEKEVTRVGSSSATPIDVRVIGATHRDLRVLCRNESFRWDLFYRLSLAELRVPALCERGVAETKVMIDFFLESKRKKYGRKLRISLSTEARARLESYRFPGNVRELENLIESLYIFCDNEAGVSDLPFVTSHDIAANFRLDELERRHIEAAYKYFDRNKKRTATELGVTYNTLNNKLTKYAISD